MGELKSAWEIAQERAARLGRLSAEEKEQQERQECRQIGEALAQKWLAGSRPVNMAAELNNYEETKRRIIKQALIERLSDAIELTTSQSLNNTKRAIEAIISLEPGLQPKIEKINELVQEYESAEQKARQELESRCKEILHQLRISGTAIDSINIEADPKWQQVHQELVATFAPRLNDLKQTLIG